MGKSKLDNLSLIPGNYGKRRLSSDPIHAFVYAHMCMHKYTEPWILRQIMRCKAYELNEDITCNLFLS